MPSETDIREHVTHALRDAALLSAVDLDTSQFLDMGANFFVMIRLTDATYLEAATSVLKELRVHLGKTNVRLECVLRPRWFAGRIGDTKPCQAEGGGIRSATCFEAEVTSGNRRHTVEVAVTTDALDVMHEKLASHVPAKDYVGRNRIARDFVRRFLDELVNRDGESYWDPITNPRLTLNRAAANTIISAG